MRRTTPVHRMETEDLVCAAVRFASGAVGVIDATTAAYPGGPERIELIGDHGRRRRSPARRSDVHYHDGRSEQLAADASPGGTGADPMAFPHDYHLGVWRDFLDALDDGRPPRIIRRRSAEGAPPDRRTARSRRDRPEGCRPLNAARSPSEANQRSLLLASISRGGWHGCASTSQRSATGQASSRRPL